MVWIAAAALFLLAPLSAIVLAGLPGLFELPPEIWPATLRSLVISMGAVALTIALALPLASRAGEAASLLGISVSGLVLGTGLFLLLQPYVRPSDVALPVTMLVNVLMALPFVLRILRPSLETAEADFGRLGASLSFCRVCVDLWVLQRD